MFTKALSNRCFIAIGIVVLGYLVYALSFSHRGMMHDDLGLIYSSKITSLSDLKNVFTADQHAWGVPNYERFSKAKKVSAFNALFRPFAMTITGLLQNVFGTNPYSFYLFNVCLHIINALLMFYIFLLLFPVSIASLGAFFFLFHGSLSWIYILFTHQDLFNLFFTLLVFLSYSQFIKSESQKWYFLSAFLFFIGLFNREVIIVVPMCIALYLAFFRLKKPLFDLRNFIYLFKKLYLFIFPIVIYAFTRLYIFGLGVSSSRSIIQVHSLKE